MGIVFRQSIKTTISIFAGALIGALFNYACTYIFKDNIHDFGFIKTLNNIGVVFQAYVLVGTGAMIQVFIQRYPGHDERKPVLLTMSLLAVFLTFLLLLIPYVIFKENIIHIFKEADQFYIRQYYCWIPSQIILWAMMTFFDLYLISQHKIAVSAFVREVVLRLINILILFLFFVHSISFDTFIIISVLSYGISAAILILIASRTEGFGFSLNLSVFTQKEYKEIIHFSWYHMLMGISFYVIGYLDCLMLAPLDKNGLSAVGIYSISIFIVAIVVIPYRAMTSASIPTLNEAYINNDMVKVRNLFYRSGINLLIVSVAMFLLIVLNLSNAVAILPKEYEEIKPLVMILILGKMIDMATGLNSELIGISKLYKFNFYISIVLLIIAFVLNRLLIPQYGVFGAAWASTTALTVYNVLKYIFLWHKMKIQPFTNKSFYVLLSGCITWGVVSLLPVIYHPVLDTIIRSVLLLIIYIGLLFIFKPSPDLLEYIHTVKKNKRLF